MSPEVIASIDAIKVNMNVGGMNVINIVLAFVMFGVALGIKPETFLDVIKKPKSFILGIICQMILLPGLTFLLALAMKDMISPMIGLGMILVASCPGGNISNFITSLSRGNTELSVSLTAVNTGVCIFTTPANFALWGGRNTYIISPRQDQCEMVWGLPYRQRAKGDFQVIPDSEDARHIYGERECGPGRHHCLGQERHLCQ